MTWQANRGGDEVTNIKAAQKLERQKNLICNDCIHPAMVGWCENHCRLSEAFDMAFSALKKREDGDSWDLSLLVH